MDVVTNSAALFRMRARECRRMAAEVKAPDWRNTLLSLAQDLEDEADQIDAENKPS